MTNEEVEKKLDEMNALLNKLIELNEKQLCYLYSIAFMSKNAEIYKDFQKVNDEINDFMSKN